MPHTSEAVYPKSNKARKLPFNKADDELFLLRQEIFGRYMAIISEWMGERCWPWDHPWSRTWQKESPGLAQFDKEHFFVTQGPRFSTHQSSSAGHAGHAIVWSIVFLFAERNFRLCINRNFDTIFDPVLPEPNRIFGLLNLSNILDLQQANPHVHQQHNVWATTFRSGLPQPLSSLFDLIKAGATQTKTSLLKQYVAGERVDLLDDYDFPARTITES